MESDADFPIPAAGHLADNVVHFARVLRQAGLPLGTDRVLLALAALRVAGIASRQDFRAVLAACLVDRAEHRLIFDQAFHLFWKDPDLLGRILQMLLPSSQQKAAGPELAENRRLAEALFPQRPAATEAEPSGSVEIDAALTWSGREQLRKADFDTMSAAEWRAARRLVERIAPFFEDLVTRRHRSCAAGRVIDVRAALRLAGRWDGEMAILPRRSRRTRPEPIVALIDISGSMASYSRMFLHFLHAISHSDHRLHAFVFGTRLTHVTRELHARDPDVAVAAAVRAVDDWQGGTRIAAALHEFNRRWARRVLAGSPTVLLVSDGLELGETTQLAFEAERLARSCRRLVWLNPLLRYEGFAPRAAGIKVLLPLVDAHLPMHNVASLEQLATCLATAPPRRTEWN